MRRTIGELIKVVQGLVPAVRTATTSSETVIDTLGYDNVCWLVVAGDGTFVDETYSFQIHESAASDGSADASISGAVAAVTADNQTKKIQVQLGPGRMRYQFCRLTVAGSNESLACTAIAVLGVADRDVSQAPDASV